MLESVCVSADCPICSYTSPFVLRLAMFCSVACCSSIFVLSALKRLSGSGFDRQSTIFTSVSVFQTLERVRTLGLFLVSIVLAEVRLLFDFWNVANCH